MRIAINCRSFLKKEQAGIGRYAYNLVNSLSAIDSVNEYWLYARKGLFDFKRTSPRLNARNIFVKMDPFGRRIDNLIRGLNVYHAPSPEFLPSTKAKVVVTVHDLIYKVYAHTHTPQTCRTLEAQMKGIVERADKIICCSQNTIDDLKKYFDVDEDRVRLIYQGVDKKIFYPLSEEERGEARFILEKRGIPSPYIFFVGTLEPRKNLPGVLKAFAQLKEKEKFTGKLIVAGMPGWLMPDLMEKIEELEMNQDCLLLGFVPDAELRVLYNCAEMFLFPSLYEGFGFPIVEALSCGTAVVTSQTSSCGEVAADAALTVDPTSVDAIERAMIRILDEKGLKETLRARALERAKVFSFQSTAEQTLEVYSSL